MRTPSAAYSTVGQEAKEQRGAEQAILESPALQAALRHVLAMSLHSPANPSWIPHPHMRTVMAESIKLHEVLQAFPVESISILPRERKGNDIPKKQFHPSPAW